MPRNLDQIQLTTTNPISMRSVTLASVLGSIVEWYDFFLYGTMAALVFNKEFFPSFDPVVGSLVAFTTFAAGFITRPLGGLIFGHFGDRLGRKKILVLTMLIMGISSFLIGCLPTYATVGAMAPVLLLIMRMLQGIGLGGEWGGAAILTFEHAPDHRRGWFTSWPQTGVPLGLLLSTIAINLASIGGDDVLIAWSWRLPFLFSGVLVVVGLVVRLRVNEPQSFIDIARNNAQSRVPAFEVIKKYPKQLLLGTCARFSESVTFNVYNAFIVTYVTVVLKLPGAIALRGLLIASVIGFFVIPIAGRLSDKYGRRPVFGAGAGIAAVTAFPIFALVNTETTGFIWLAIVVGWSLGACTMFGPEAAMFAELFPARVRYTGMSIVYQIGVLPSGAIAPALCVWLVSVFGASWPVAIYVTLGAILALVGIKFLPETAGKPDSELVAVSSKKVG